MSDNNPTLEPKTIETLVLDLLDRFKLLEDKVDDNTQRLDYFEQISGEE